MTYIFLTLVIAFILYVQFGPKLSNMKEGMWTITVETKMPGAIAETLGTYSQHLTKAAPVPHVPIPKYACRLFRKRHPVHIIGNFVFWKIHCEGPGPDITGAGHIKYHKDSFKGKLQMHTMEDNQKRFTTYISGVRAENFQG